MKVIARETIAYIKTPSSSCLYLRQVYEIPHNFQQILDLHHVRLDLPDWGKLTGPKIFQGFGICEPVGGKPFQDGVLIKEVVPVNAGELAPEVDEGRHLVHPVLLGVPSVVHLDHGDVQSVRFIVYFLQSFNCLVAFDTVVFIWKLNDCAILHLAVFVIIFKDIFWVKSRFYKIIR